ncbi:response regulator [Roseivivax marinus]|uniref:response regulator n=1 Tax=Roseivivax marinus TaxID=1379903 RepID=UPI00273F6498|nr:response regulator [Roseivivax marinus]
MDDQDTGYGLMRPTAARPLLGLTVLMVEDSRYACDVLRLMCIRSGARIRRADCLRSARRHLEVYRPSAALIDMGLPDGSGAELLEDMARSTPRVPVLLGMSGDAFAEPVALAAGADGFLAKPFAGLSAFQSAILRHLPPEWQPAGARIVDKAEMRADPVAFRDDMAHAAAVLSGAGDEATTTYVARFVAGVARSAGDDPVVRAAEALLGGQAGARGHLSALLSDRVLDREAV